MQSCSFLSTIEPQVFLYCAVVKICTAFEIIDGATLDDGKLKVLESGSHRYVVTCAVSFEFKWEDKILSLCSTCFVRFSGAVGKMLSYNDAGPGSILARKEIFFK